ncbi:MAG: GAF domain-containing protein [Chloroflexaceae bacterium]|nr:GAF domain-containing protein [Chloroflexaceae bacterium]
MTGETYNITELVAYEVNADSNSPIKRSETSPSQQSRLTETEATATPSIPENPTNSSILPETLIKIASSLVTVLDHAELLNILLPRLMDVMPGFQAGLLWLLDRRTGRLQVATDYALPLETSTRTALVNCQLISGEGVAGQTMQSQKPILWCSQNGYLAAVARNQQAVANTIGSSNQVVMQQLHDQLPALLTIVSLPLKTTSETVGCLECWRLAEPDDTLHTTQWLTTLQHIGPLLAAHIVNSQRYLQSQRHCRRLDAFDAVVTAISTSTDLQDLVYSVLDVILGLLPVSAGGLWLLDPSQDCLVMAAFQGIADQHRADLRNIAVTGSACEEVVRYGQPTVRPLMEERGEADLIAAGLASSAYLPLLAGGTVVGVMGLYGDALLHRELDMARLMPLGNQIGFAIANVRLYQDSQLERGKLSMVINSIAEGVIVCDRKGQLILANEAAMEMLSLDVLPFEQTLGEMVDFYDIRDLEGQPISVEQLPFSMALSGDVFHDYRLIFHANSINNRVLSFSGAPARSPSDDIEGAVVIMRDITASQKLERAKDEFLAVAAHELRSPLAAVRSYAEMLLRRERQRTEADSLDRRGLTILSQQVNHMLRMVDNLLDMSRLEAGQIDLQLQRINLVALANQVIDQQQHAVGSHELVLNIEEPEIWVICDSLRIRQVMTNLLSNGIKYSPADTRVTLRIGIIDQVDTHQDMSSDLSSEAQPTHSVIVSVHDMGNGINPEEQARLFQRFYRTRPRGRRIEGLGLGLYLSRQFILMHGGQIWVESNEGQGSTFAFTLPARREE